MLITLIHSFNCLCQASTMCLPKKQGGQRSLISSLLPLSRVWGTVLTLHSMSKRTSWQLLLKNVNNFSLRGPLLHLQTQLTLMLLVCILMRDHRQFIEMPIISISICTDISLFLVHSYDFITAPLSDRSLIIIYCGPPDREYFSLLSNLTSELLRNQKTKFWNSI